MATLHRSIIMTEVTAYYSKKSMQRHSFWRGLFVCAICGRETMQIKNLLGQRDLVCNGVKISKERRVK
jgi:hypothetical protein